MRTRVRESIASSLKIDKAGLRDDRSFTEYGVDSIIAVQLVNDINERYRLLLRTTALFDYNTIEQLTQHIVSTHRSDLIETLASVKGSHVETVAPPARL